MFVSVLITISVSMLALCLLGLAVWFVGRELEEEREAVELKRGGAQRTRVAAGIGLSLGFYVFRRLSAVVSQAQQANCRNALTWPKVIAEDKESGQT
ncbi:MAG: hypothetical protein ABWZ64_12380 [Xanthobacteraceae bacterium]|jgi:hypothetical protein